FCLATGILYANSAVTSLIHGGGIDPLPFRSSPRYLSSMGTKGGNGKEINLQQFVQDVKTVVHDGEALLKAGMAEAKKRAVSGAKSTDRVVRLHPYHSLGVVFGLGVFVGVLAVSMFLSSSSEEEETD